MLGLLGLALASWADLVIVGFLGACFGPLGAHLGRFGDHSWPLGLLGAQFGAPGGHFLASSGRVPGGARKGYKTLKTAKNNSKTCLLSIFQPLGRPQNSSHSIISGCEKRYFLAFGCDFEGEKCLGQRQTRRFEVFGNA